MILKSTVVLMALSAPFDGEETYAAKIKKLDKDLGAASTQALRVPTARAQLVQTQAAHKKEALALVEKAAKEDLAKLSTEDLSTLAATGARYQKFDEAEKFAKAAIAKDDKNVVATVALINSLVGKKDLKGADAIFGAAKFIPAQQAGPLHSALYSAHSRAGTRKKR